MQKYVCYFLVIVTALLWGRNNIFGKLNTIFDANENHTNKDSTICSYVRQNYESDKFAFWLWGSL